MKKGAPKQHLVKRSCPGGVQTLFMSTVSQFGLFFGGPGALKKQLKLGQKALKMEAWALKKRSGDRFKKVKKFGSIFGHFWGSKWTPGGVQLRYRESLASQKTVQNVKLCSNNGFEPKSCIGPAPFIWTQFHVLRDFALFFWWFMDTRFRWFPWFWRFSRIVLQTSIFWCFWCYFNRFFDDFWSIFDQFWII